VPYSVEKKTFASTESQRAEIQERREEFAKEAALIDRDRFVFLDESGRNVAMTPSHGWAPSGHRKNDNKPTNWGKNISVIRATRTAGLVSQRRFKGPVNSLGSWTSSRRPSARSFGGAISL
jgi:hypothetical protein